MLVVIGQLWVVVVCHRVAVNATKPAFAARVARVLDLPRPCCLDDDIEYKAWVVSYFLKSDASSVGLHDVCVGKSCPASGRLEER